ncbi:MAG: histidinol-phosphate transaminase [Verrucomicrobiales bacterium]
MNAETTRPKRIRSKASPRQIKPLEIRRAGAADRPAIYRLRHNAFAAELRQHPPSESGALSDPIDAHNDYIVAVSGAEVVGCISLTSPDAPRFSLEKYIARDEIGRSDETWEVRLLCVAKKWRKTAVSALLMYAALRWVESKRGGRIVGMGRADLAEFYRDAGLRIHPETHIRSGAVNYVLMDAAVPQLRARAVSRWNLLRRASERVRWKLGARFEMPAPCFHGGAFFEAIGDRFDDLDRRRSVINADVLDAWFDPAPSVLSSIGDALPWALRTSPPTDCGGLIEAIASARGVPRESVLPGAGSSDLIFRAFLRWMAMDRRALLLDPTYGEYAHVLENVIGCRVDRFPLRKDDGYRVDPAALQRAFAGGYDLAVIVNPNSPTGGCIARDDLAKIAACAPPGLRIWIDETYIDYAGGDHSAEAIAAHSENVYVCKSMSKAYALSGARCAYLCAAPHNLEDLRAITPPWVVGLPSQIAAVRALESPRYYRRRWSETHVLRAELSGGLERLGWTVIPGIANFVLAHLPEAQPEAAAVVALCREEGLFLRDAAKMGKSLGKRAIRIAVKDRETNGKMLEIIASVLAAAQRQTQSVGSNIGFSSPG